MRHSELTTDLHYARLRTFTGNPASLTPDFFDQILTATDTNKVYRATGTNQGALVELSPPPVLPEQRVIFEETFPEPQSQTQLLVRVDQNRIYRANGILPTDWLEIVGADGGGNGGGSSAISVGNNPPQNAPTALGEQYFDSRNNHLFIAIADGATLTWRNTTPPITVYESSFNSPDLSAYSAVTGNWTWAYADLLSPPPLWSVMDFEFYGYAYLHQDLESAIAQYGAGYYAPYFDLQDPNSEISSWDMSVSLDSGFSPDPSISTVSAQVNGKSTTAYYFSPNRRLGAQISFSGSVNIY